MGSIVLRTSHRSATKGTAMRWAIQRIPWTATNKKQGKKTEFQSGIQCNFGATLMTYLAHADFAVGFEQEPADRHTDQIWTKTSPRFVVDFVKQRQGIVCVWHVIVLVCNKAGGDPWGYHECDQHAWCHTEVSIDNRQMKHIKHKIYRIPKLNEHWKALTWRRRSKWLHRWYRTVCHLTNTNSKACTVQQQNKHKRFSEICSKWNRKCHATHHILYWEQRIDVQHISPPVFWAIDMIHCGRIEHRLMFKVFHRNLNQSQHKHVRCRQTNESIENQAQEMESAGRNFIDAFCQFLQVALCICTEVDVGDKETAA